VDGVKQEGDADDANEEEDQRSKVKECVGPEARVDEEIVEAEARAAGRAGKGAGTIRIRILEPKMKSFCYSLRKSIQFSVSCA